MSGIGRLEKKEFEEFKELQEFKDRSNGESLTGTSRCLLTEMPRDKVTPAACG